MKTVLKPTAQRSSAEERREEILEAAVTEFALKGLHGTSTETIARRVGISQPYLFRLFGTKKDLFLAATNRAFERVMTSFRLAVERTPETPFTAMALAYQDLLPHREEMLLQMQAYVACADPEVQAVVRARFAELYQFVEQATGAPADEVRDFFAMGMLLNVAAALDLPAVMGKEDWVQRCLPPRP